MNKILFLDFDGVIRVYKNIVFVDQVFSLEKMNQIAEICETLGVKIVISSDWRSDGHEKISKLTYPLAKYFHENWMTPILGDRWKEIDHWLLKNKNTDKFAIIDDCDFHFDGAPDHILDSLVLCDGSKGVEEEEIEKITCILK